MKVSRTALPIACFCLTAGAIAQTVNTIYVSPSGSDANSGSQTSPKRTVFAAMDTVRQMRSAGTSGQYVVQIAPGTYAFDRSLIIGSSEGGAPGAPLVFRGETKEVFFDGSRSVTGWQKVSGTPYYTLSASARDQVFVAALPRSGNAMLESTAMDTGFVNRRGFPYQTTQTWSSLVFNGQAMDLARHPNSGWLTVPTTYDGSPSSIPVADAAPYSWRNTGDIWAYGYFGWDWADSFENVYGFDSATGKMNLGTTPYYGIRKGQRFVLVNAFEALDVPGEYFIDRAAGLVYFYPPLAGMTDLQKVSALEAGARLTSYDTNFVEVNGASNVEFENVTFQNGRRSAVLIRAGNRVAFKGCTFRRFNYHAIIVAGGFNHLFQSCDFYDLDEAAMRLEGGDRATLTRSGHLVVNCLFRDYSKLCRTYRPAITIYGVGNTVRNCRIEDAPHSGIVIHGNDNSIEGCEFYRLCTQTTDSGAVYIGRNPTYQGNRVVYNRFQDIWTRQTGNYSNFTAGVYMDDMASGMEVSFNLFKNVQIGAVLGGGRDVRLDNNYFFGGGKAVHFDARGTSWASDFMTRWNVPGMLAEVPYQQSVWAAKYPNLVNFLNDEPERPKRDSLTHSVYVGPLDWLLLLDNLTTSSDLSINPQIYSASNSVTLSDPGFVDMTNENFGFVYGSALPGLGIKSLDMSVVGMYSDAYRTSDTNSVPPPPPPAPADTAPPTVPSGLAAVSGSGKGQVTLKWSASTDDSGTVSKYEVYKGNTATGSFSLVGSMTSLGCVDNAGRGKKRYYYIVAVDAAGNRSAKSSVILGVGMR